MLLVQVGRRLELRRLPCKRVRWHLQHAVDSFVQRLHRLSWGAISFTITISFTFAFTFAVADSG